MGEGVSRNLPHLEASSEWLVGNGEMAERIRNFNWSKTALGPFDVWSPALRTTIGLMLSNRFPMLLWWGPDYLSLYNDAYVPILGLKHPRALGLPVRECWSEIWDVLKPLIDTPFDGGPSTWIEDFELYLQRSGFTEETHFTVAYSPVPDATVSNGIGGVLATVHEISEKVIAQRRVAILRDLGVEGAESTVEETCRAAMQTLARHNKDIPFALLYLVDPDGRHARLAATARIEPGNDASPLLVSLDRSEIDRGWPFGAGFRADSILEVRDIAFRFEAIPPGPWAEPPHTAVVVPLRSGKANEPFGLLIGGVSSRLKFDEQYRDFYELAASQIATGLVRARAYAEERRRVEALAEIDRAKTLFFTNVSHEFRTPLTLMLGPLESLIANPDLAIAQRERLDVVQRNSLRLLKLVNSLLDFSRIEAGRSQPSYEPTDIAALTRELASNFLSACQHAGLELVVDCPPLPEPTYVDRDMWEKIVLNLISNAFKFTFDGEIEVRLRAVNGHGELSIRDTGVGVPRHELPHLFERFHRIEGQRSRTHEGSGIGLALVQELVKMHGGKIDAESEVGRGTKFTITIPFGTAHLPQHRIGAERQPASTSIRAEAYVQEALRWLPEAPPMADALLQKELLATAPSPRRARILVADDNSDMRGYLRGLLEERYVVETAEDGQAALLAIRERRPDLLVADVMMPQLDGFGLLRAIRSDPELRDLPVIVLSGRAGEESRIEGIAVGADDYLIKPFSARELVARVSARLELDQLRREGVRAQRLLLRELAHRVKNTLANVQAIAQQTLRQTSTADEFVAAFGGRMQSLSRAHSLLSDVSWQGAALDELVRNQLIYDASESRIDAEGPVVTFNAQMALHVALILHELRTNAAKYGALSSAGGKVTIRWAVADGNLHLKWRETGGPRVEAPARRGFGTTLIEQSAIGEHGSARMLVAPDGVSWDITLPIDSETAASVLRLSDHEMISASNETDKTEPAGEERQSRPAPRRILVVEDEPLIALDVVASVESLGLEVIGPATSAERAFDLIESSEFDGALLDANLAGRPVDDIADALSRRKIPFVFVTGYNRESLPQAFRAALMLCKPFSRSQLQEVLGRMAAEP